MFEPDVPCKSVKTSTAIVLGLCATAVICCSGVGFFGYRVFTGAKAIDGEADHYADQVFPQIATTWDGDALKREMAPEWSRGQSADDTKEWLGQCKDWIGNLRSAKPFTTTNTQYRSFNMTSVAYVTVVADASFTKADAKVIITLAKRRDWKIVSINLGSVKRLKQGLMSDAQGFRKTD